MQVEPLRAEYQRPRRAARGRRRAGPRRGAALPDARVRRRGGAQATTSPRRWPASRRSTAGSRRTGASRTSDRLIAAPMLSLADPDAAVAEVDSLHRARRAHRAHPARAGARRRTARVASLGDKLHDPVWARLAEASVPVAFHLGDSGYNALRGGVGRQRTRSASATATRSAQILVSDRAIHDTIASLVVHGVFKRHPTLRVASIENGSDWMRAARQAAAQAGQPDAVGLRRRTRSTRSASHVWVTPYYEEDLASAGRPRSASSASCSAPTGPTAKGSPSRSTSSKELAGFDEADVRKIMRDNCLELLGPAPCERRADASAAPDARCGTRSQAGSTSTGTPTSRSTSGGGSSPTAGWTAPHFTPEQGGRGLPARAQATVRVGVRRPRRAAAAGRPRAADGRADDPHPRHPRPDRAARAADPRGPGRRGASCSASPAPAPTSPGLTTRAVRDGDQLDHQRPEGVEQPGAWSADYGMLLARTDFDVPKHAGISWFAFPLDQPGVDDPAAARDDGRGGVQRGVPRRRGRATTPTSSAARATAGRSPRPRCTSSAPASAPAARTPGSPRRARRAACSAAAPATPRATRRRAAT